jgi:hypothetical protein
MRARKRAKRKKRKSEAGAEVSQAGGAQMMNRIWVVGETYLDQGAMASKITSSLGTS